MLTPSLSISFKDFRHYIIYGWKREGNYLYIGQSIRFLRRIRNDHHVINKKEKVLPTDILDIWFCYNHEDLNKLEKKLIRELRPKYNKEVRIGGHQSFDDYFSERDYIIEELSKIADKKGKSFKESIELREIKKKLFERLNNLSSLWERRNAFSNR